MIADSYNDFLKEKLTELFGTAQCAKFMEESEKQRPTVIRTNTSKTKRKDLVKSLQHRGMELQALDWNSEAIVVFKSPVPVGATPEYLCGLYSIQGASSLLPVLNLELKVNKSDLYAKDTVELQEINTNDNGKKLKRIKKSNNHKIESEEENRNHNTNSKDSAETLNIHEETENPLNESSNTHEEIAKIHEESSNIHDQSSITHIGSPNLHEESVSDYKKASLADKSSSIKNSDLDFNSNPTQHLSDSKISEISVKKLQQAAFTPQTEKTALQGKKTTKTSSKLHVLDMCAAPGGKTTHIATLLGDSGTVYAYDIDRERCRAVTSNLMRLGLSNTLVVHQDARDIKMPNFFDRVLLDAPCSGTGVISKDPDVKISRSYNDIDKTVRLQKELILKAFHCLKVGGVLVYSTCSVLVDENESVVDYLIKKNIGAKLEATDTAVGVKGMKRFREHIFHPSMDLTKRIYPHMHNMDGFFIAKIRKHRV